MSTYEVRDGMLVQVDDPPKVADMVAVVRCKDCATFIRDATPHDDDRPHFCSELGVDLADGDGFCAWGVRRDS